MLPRRGVRIALLFAAACLCCAGLRATENLKDLQDRFDHETQAGRKIKQLRKLALAQFAAASDASRAGNFVDVGLIIEKYRDNVRAAFELLRKQEPDADRHPGGYRQLELGVRQGIREVEDALLAVSDEIKPPLQIVRKDLLDMDDALINLLFPRRMSPVNPPQTPEAKP